MVTGSKTVKITAFGGSFRKDSYNMKLKDNSIRDMTQRIDYLGNIVFGSGLTIFLLAITYGLLPYGTSVMGWGNPWVIAGMISGSILLIAFPYV